MVLGVEVGPDEDGDMASGPTSGGPEPRTPAASPRPGSRPARVAGRCQCLSVHARPSSVGAPGRWMGQRHRVEVYVVSRVADVLALEQLSYGLGHLCRHAIRLPGCGPTWVNHCGIPCPMPAWNRPADSRAAEANSIARYIGLRTAAGAMPRPTWICVVAVSAEATCAMPPASARSSHTHSSSKPDSSADRARRTASSAGRPSSLNRAWAL